MGILFLPPQAEEGRTVIVSRGGTVLPAAAAMARQTAPRAEGTPLLVNRENPVPFDHPGRVSDPGGDFWRRGRWSTAKGRSTEAGKRQKDVLAARAEGSADEASSSAYRSIAYQEKLWQARRRQDPCYGDDPYTNPVKAMPGCMSEHTTGLALDILSENHETANDAYGETPEGRWLAENAHRYGFILRYPEGKGHITGVIYEPWHYRYVGVEAATEIWERGICLKNIWGHRKSAVRRFFHISGILFLMFGNLLDVIGGFLIDIIVEPVAEKQVGMAAPAHDRRLCGIVAGIVVLGNVDGKPFGDIPVIFPFQSVGVIFVVAGDKNLPALFCGDEINARFRGFGDNLQLGIFFNIFLPDAGMAGMGA